jgi:hypothetical protein
LQEIDLTEGSIIGHDALTVTGKSTPEELSLIKKSLDIPENQKVTINILPSKIFSSPSSVPGCPGGKAQVSSQGQVL